MVRVQVDRLDRRGADANAEAQQTLRDVVENTLRYGPRMGGVPHAGVIRAAGHSEVDAGPYGRHRVVDGPPVGDNDAVEPPFFTKYLGDKPSAFIDISAVDPVVR